MNFEAGKIYELYKPNETWVVYVKVIDIYDTIEGKMIRMERLLLKGDVEFPQTYEILKKHIGQHTYARKCEQSDVVLELLGE